MNTRQAIIFGCMLLLISACAASEQPATAEPFLASSAAQVSPSATLPSPTTPPSVTPTGLPPTVTPPPSKEPSATSPPSPTPTTKPTPTQTPVPTAAPEYPRFAPHECRYELPHGLNVECGYVLVLEDRSDPDGNVVKLPVVVFHSRSRQPLPDPVIYLTGGGGGNELDNIGRYANVILNVVRDRDYIMYTQRGGRHSQPYLQCSNIDAFYADLAEQNLAEAEYEARELEYMQQCAESFRAEGLDLNQYNTVENAADLNDIRLALGYDKINIYGTSYGTRLALAVMRDYPQILRSAIIDSVFPPQTGFFSEYATNAYHAFTRVFQACEADADCAERYPDVEATLYEVVAALNEQPRTMMYEGRQLTYDGADFLDALYLIPYMHEGHTLPWIVYAVSQGQYDPIEWLLPFTLEVTSHDTIAAGAQNSILCREEIPYESYQDLLDLGSALPRPFFETYDSDGPWRLCEVWGVAPAEPYVNDPVTSHVPTLVLEGTFDPITPLEWGRLAAETVQNCFYYEFPGVGHGVMRTDDCGLQIGLQFLDDPTTEPDTSCLDHVSIPGFQ
jgi:pimeloyl-ACP methyl ester carboxylesterase